MMFTNSLKQFSCILMLLCFQVFFNECLAQSTDSAAAAPIITIDTVFPKPDKRAMPPIEWLDVLKKNYVYPPQARLDYIRGTVIVKFIVEIDGSLSNIEAESIHTGTEKGIMYPPFDQRYELLAKEAVRLIGLLPNYTPASLDGKPIRSKYKIPVSFGT